MRFLLLFLACFFVGSVLAPSASAQDAPWAVGSWKGELVLPNGALEVMLYVENNDGVLEGKMDIPAQGAVGLPVSNVSVDGDLVHFELAVPNGTAMFDGERDGEGFVGQMSQGEFTTTFLFDPAEPVDEAPEATDTPGEPYDAEVDGGSLSGTLLLPDGNGPFPVAVIHAGSGPTDRDGNSAMMPGKNNSLRYLAEALAAEGIATYRYDKRGVGASLKPENESDLLFGTYVADLEAVAAQLASDDRFASVVLVGHSEGGMIALEAGDVPSVAAVVTVSAPGRTFQTVIREQLGKQLPPALMAQADSLISQIEAGETVADVPPMLASIFRPSVQPYLQSVFAIDPAETAKQLGKPILVTQGTTDLQASITDAELLAEAESAELVLIEGMNHVLKDVSGAMPAQLPSYGDPELPVNAELIERVAAFVASK